MNRPTPVIVYRANTYFKNGPTTLKSNQMFFFNKSNTKLIVQDIMAYKRSVNICRVQNTSEFSALTAENKK